MEGRGTARLALRLALAVAPGATALPAAEIGDPDRRSISPTVTPDFRAVRTDPKVFFKGDDPAQGVMSISSFPANSPATVGASCEASVGWHSEVAAGIFG
ncbi:hypothetical protein [Defluviimonas sp. SAOS-178_SWC]|uniref:hypothetical protein n=1 Tax=Defluviimonas sp. SAOS-178_SWC TaxID=3121287 RepID=UPI0032218E61